MTSSLLMTLANAAITWLLLAALVAWMFVHLVPRDEQPDERRTR